MACIGENVPLAMQGSPHMLELFTSNTRPERLGHCILHFDRTFHTLTQGLPLWGLPGSIPRSDYQS
jgi:hypothetical protein